MFYPDAWLSSTSIILMTPAEEGAYIRLICHAWLSPDCGLPNGDEELAALSRLGSRWKKSAAKIRPKFEQIGDRLFNPRLLEEREKQAEWSRKSSEAGKKSAARRGATTVEPPLNHRSDLVEEWLEPNLNFSTRVEREKESEDPKEKPSWEDLNENWKWFVAEYPGNVNEFIDKQLFLSVMKTPEDLAQLRANLPLWKETERWRSGFFKESKNFLSERIFKLTPKPDAVRGNGKGIDWSKI